jgi:hypothetical protein
VSGRIVDFWHFQQLVQGVEHLKLIRRAAHIVSILGFLLPASCATAAQSQRPDSEGTKNQKTVPEPTKPSEAATITEATNSESSKKDTEPQSLETYLFEKALDPIFWVTVAIAFFTRRQVAIYREMRDHTMAIERAYIGFGAWLSLGPRIQNTQQLLMTVQFFNFGNTPAEIDKVVLAFDIGDDTAPQPPRYTQTIPTEPIRVFLVKGGELFLTRRLFTMDGTRWDAIRNSNLALRLLGYVEYTDRFKRRHRAGYGRLYEAGTESEWGDGQRPPKIETLPIESAPNYNYDEQQS